MKKGILLSFIALGCFVLNAQNKIINVPKKAAPITIDGEVDAEWSKAVSFDVSQWGKGKPIPDAADFSANFKLIWDDSYLYFLGTIVDDKLLTSAEAADLAVTDWEVDNFELYWSPGNSKLADQTEMTQIRLAYANAASEEPAPGIYSEGGFTLGEFVVAAKKETANGYIFEASFDLAVSAEAAGKDALVKNDTIGFNAVACDNDGETNRENIGGIITDFKYNQADTLLRLVLSEAANYIVSQKSNVAKVYPNPASQEIRIANSSIVKSIELINLNGQVVLTSSKINGTIGIGSLQKGIYEVKMITNSGTLHEKLVIR